jgi:glycosyltransferase involved in cell wall biosynthesis
MRVLFVVTAFPAYREDPRGTHVFRIATQVAGTGERVIVVAPTGPGAVAQEWMDGVEIRRFRYALGGREKLATGVSGIVPNLRAHPQLALQVPPFVMQMTRAVRRSAPECDLLHAHWLYPSGLVAIRERRRTGIPVVVTAHGGDVNLAMRNPLLGRLVRRVGNGADRVLSVSDDLAEKLVALGVRSTRIQVVPLGVEPRQVVRTSVSGVAHIAFVGSLIARKGVDVLLRALQALPADLVEIDILGDGPERTRLEKMAEGVATKVRFHGEVAPSAVASVLERVDALVLPSWSEGRPVVVMEAMAAGIPVIASRIAGTSELVEHEITGLLFDVGDATGLADALRRIATEPDVRQRLGSAGMAALRERALTAEMAARRHVDVYREVVDIGSLSNTDDAGADNG